MSTYLVTFVVGEFALAANMLLRATAVSPLRPVSRMMEEPSPLVGLVETSGSTVQQQTHAIVDQPFEETLLPDYPPRSSRPLLFFPSHISLFLQKKTVRRLACGGHVGVCGGHGHVCGVPRLAITGHPAATSSGNRCFSGIQTYPPTKRTNPFNIIGFFGLAIAECPAAVSRLNRRQKEPTPSTSSSRPKRAKTVSSRLSDYIL